MTRTTRADRVGPQPAIASDTAIAAAHDVDYVRKNPLMPTFTHTGMTLLAARGRRRREASDEIEAAKRAREQCRIVQSVGFVREGKNLLTMITRS